MKSSCRLRAALVAGCVSLAFSSESRAALSSSEKAQVRDFVASARLENAGRVRTLVARTDHTEAEAFEALTAAVAAVPFTDARGALLKEIVFGGASAASRPLLSIATVRALLARADGIFEKYVGGLDHEAQAIAELSSIYAFLDGVIANPGRPTATAHDPGAGIPNASYEAATRAIGEHVERHARWLKGEGAIPEVVAPLRAQAQALLVDLLPDGAPRRADAAERLGLQGARRRMLVEWGLLFADTGKLDDGRVTRIREALARLPAARIDLSVVYVGPAKAPIRSRGYVAIVSASSAGPRGATNPFGEEVSGGAVDPATSSVILDLSTLASRRVLDNKPELRRLIERDAASAAMAEDKVLGRPRGPGVDQVAGAAIQLLLLDAPRARDLAFARLLDRRPESAALLSDALGVLAAFAPSPGAGAGAGTASPEGGVKLELGRADGAAEPVTVRLGANGAATALAFDGHTWAFDRQGPAFGVAGATHDDAPVTLASLPSARAPMREAARWQEAGFTFTKLRGAPRAAISPPRGGATTPNVTMIGTGQQGYDAIATTFEGDDVVVEGDLDVKGGVGGIAVRAGAARDAVRGAILTIDPAGRTVLAASDEAGKESLLAAPIDPSPASPVHVKLTLRGNKIEATVGTATLKGTLPPNLSKGDLALVAKRGVTVSVGSLTVAKPAAAPKKPPTAAATSPKK